MLIEHDNDFRLEVRGHQFKVRKHAIERARQRLYMTGHSKLLAATLIEMSYEAFNKGTRLDKNRREWNGVVYCFKAAKNKKRRLKVGRLCLATVYPVGKDAVLI